MKSLLIYIALFFSVQYLVGQDLHFSQFQRSYLTLNPANTGNFVGDYRFNGNYRNQWSSISEPYRTFLAAFDASHPIANLPQLKLGIVLLNDEAGVGGLTENAININAGYAIKITPDSTWVLKTGLQVGFSARSIDFDRFTFDNQYNGRSFDPQQSTGEDFARNSLAHLNLGTGFAFEHMLSRTDKIEIGISVFNLNAPNISFDNQVARLDTRTNFYAQADFLVSEKLSVLPAILVTNQSKFREFLFGSNVKYRFDSQKGVSNLYGGIWMRTGDAFIFTAGIDYEQWNLGLSYDVNFSDLKTSSNRRGGLEISVTYIFKKYIPNLRRYKVCPNFM